jgi:hypothetical protein
MTMPNAVMLRMMVKILEMELASNMCTRTIYETRSNLFMTKNRMNLLECQNQIFFGINFSQ